MDENWVCEAYGPGGIGIGALCFFAEQGERACDSQIMCHMAMTTERQRVFSRISELAAQGDPVWREIAADFTSPERLPGGGEATGPADPQTGHPGTGPAPPG